MRQASPILTERVFRDVWTKVELRRAGINITRKTLNGYTPGNVDLYKSNTSLKFYLKHSTFEYCCFCLALVFIYLFIVLIHMLSYLFCWRALEFDSNMNVCCTACHAPRSYRNRFCSRFYICQEVMIKKKLACFFPAGWKHRTFGPVIEMWPLLMGTQCTGGEILGLSIVFSGYFSIALNRHVIRRWY